MVHIGVNILIEMELFLCFGDTASGRHVEGVEEIWMAIVKLPAEPRYGASGKGTKRLFLSSGKVS